MGDSDDGRPDGPDQPEALEGEIVPAKRGPYWTNSNGQGRHAGADEDLVRQVIADRVSGMTLKQVAAKWGVSHQTVSNWAGEDRRNRSRVEAAEARGEAAQQLAVARDRAWELYRLGRLTRNPKLMSEALTRVESITGNKARLEGAIKPIRVDVEVYAVTEAERELQEMLNEAAAKAAAQEQAVVDAASADPDL